MIARHLSPRPSPPGRDNPALCVCLHVCLHVCEAAGVCTSACAVVARSLGGCSAAVDACSSDSIVSVSKDLPAALFHHLFIMLIQRTNETREEGERRLGKHAAGVIFPLLSPSFHSLSPPSPLPFLPIPAPSSSAAFLSGALLL